MTVQPYVIDNTPYFSGKEIYLELGKASSAYGKWLRIIVVQNPCLKVGVDYILIDDASKYRIPGRKTKHVMFTRQTAIAICIMMRTTVAQRLREMLEKA